jgi:hypothetical protein
MQLDDLIEQDLKRLYPERSRLARISVFEAGAHLLNNWDRELQVNQLVYCSFRPRTARGSPALPLCWLWLRMMHGACARAQEHAEKRFARWGIEVRRNCCLLVRSQAELRLTDDGRCVAARAWSGSSTAG